MKTSGQVAYEAYYQSSYGVSLITGVPLPKWENQRLEIQLAWEACAEAVIADLRNGL